jgi:hypothetical protein
MPVERGAIGIADTTMITHPENVFIIKNLSQIFSISPETAHRGVLDERAHQNIFLQIHLIITPLVQNYSEQKENVTLFMADYFSRLIAALIAGSEIPKIY